MAQGAKKVFKIKLKKKKPGIRINSDFKPAPKKEEDKTNRKRDELKHPLGYLDFILFIALPVELRLQIIKAETQKEFAAKIRVDEDTLTAWKKRDGFWDDVSRVRKEIFKEMVSEVVFAVKTNASKNGGAAESRLFLEYAGELKKESDPGRLPESLDRLIEKVGEFLK